MFGPLIGLGGTILQGATQVGGAALGAAKAVGGRIAENATPMNLAASAATNDPTALLLEQNAAVRGATVPSTSAAGKIWDIGKLFIAGYPQGATFVSLVDDMVQGGRKTEAIQENFQIARDVALGKKTVSDVVDKLNIDGMGGNPIPLIRGLQELEANPIKRATDKKNLEKLSIEVSRLIADAGTPEGIRSQLLAAGANPADITSPDLEKARSQTRVQLATEGSEIRSKKAAAAQAEAKAPLNKEIFVEAVQRLYPNLDLNNPHIRDYILPRASEMASSYLNTVDPNTGKVTPNIDMDIDSAITAALAQLKVVPDANTDRSWWPFSGAGAPEAGTGNVAQQYQPKQVGQSPDGNPIVDLGGGKQEEMIPMVSPDGKNKLVPASKYYYFVKTLKFKDRK